MALITDKVVLNPKATGSLPSGTEGSLAYDSTLDSLVQFGTAWNKINQGSATGGDNITVTGGFKYHTFTSGGTFTVSGGSLAVEVMLVAGGGGGGFRIGGGGAGSGVLMGSINPLPVGAYTITRGAGGTGDTDASLPNTANAGGASSFGTGSFLLLVKGGGGGFSDNTACPNPYTIACSNIGGSNANNGPVNRLTFLTNNTTHNIGSSATGTLHGNNLGGRAHSHNGSHSGGGGGGAGEAGNTDEGGSPNSGGGYGTGGDGYQNSWATPDALGYTSGSGTHNGVAYNTGFIFGGGGGGCQYSGPAGDGGAGGGGSGVSNNSATDSSGGTGGINNGAVADSTTNTSSNETGAAGAALTGGGGGGGAHGSGVGGVGGTGIIVVRYLS